MQHTDKMREEFEAWILGLGYSTSRVSGGECREDYYAYRMTNMAWLAWQASRATLVVELPSEQVEPALPLEHPDKQWPLGWNTALGECRAAIEAAGVRVKP